MGTETQPAGRRTCRTLLIDTSERGEKGESVVLKLSEAFFSPSFFPSSGWSGGKQSVPQPPPCLLPRHSLIPEVIR